MKSSFASLFVLFFLLTLGTVFAQEAGGERFPPRAILNAAYRGDAGLVQRILATNPDINVRDALGGTALHVAVFQDNIEVLRLLLDHGFDVNAQVPSNGYTPLHYCVWVNNQEAARLLISRNADRYIKCHEGFTPMDKAAKEGKREVLVELSRR